MIAEGKVGPQILADGTNATARMLRDGSVATSDAHGTFYEACARGNLYSGGISVLTTTAATTFGVGDLSATGKPIVGVWNPSNSGKNLVLLRASVVWSISAATNTGPGGLLWASSVGNAAITTGTAPINRLTLSSTGSIAKDMSGIALTGLTNTLVVKFGSSIVGGSGHHFSFVETAAGTAGVAGSATTENFDGSIIVPPGGVFGLFQSTLTVAHLVVSQILWEEVAV